MPKPTLKERGHVYAPQMPMRVDSIDGDKITCSWQTSSGRKSAVFERHALTPVAEGKRGPMKVSFS